MGDRTKKAEKNLSEGGGQTVHFLQVKECQGSIKHYNRPSKRATETHALEKVGFGGEGALAKMYSRRLGEPRKQGKETCQTLGEVISTEEPRNEATE